MSLRKLTGFAIILGISGLFWSSYSIFAFAQKDANEEFQLAKFVQSQQKNNSVYYKLQKTAQGKSIPATVYLKEQEIITFTQMAGGLTPRERAAFLVKKLDNFLQENKNPWKIFPGLKDGIAVIKYEDEILFTADVKSAAAEGLDVTNLSLKWANNLRRAFSVTELVKDFELLKMIAKNYDDIAEYAQTGVASWYGAYFHGRTAADGSIYNMYKFTAAHKTLPFGSVVKVTNLSNGNSCVVEITDRGPFIGERIIDLSKIAAEEIGMMHKGISEVKIEVIGKV